MKQWHVTFVSGGVCGAVLVALVLGLCLLVLRARLRRAITREQLVAAALRRLDAGETLAWVNELFEEQDAPAERRLGGGR